MFLGDIHPDLGRGKGLPLVVWGGGNGNSPQLPWSLANFQN